MGCDVLPFPGCTSCSPAGSLRAVPPGEVFEVSRSSRRPDRGGGRLGGEHHRPQPARTTQPVADRTSCGRTRVRGERHRTERPAPASGVIVRSGSPSGFVSDFGRFVVPRVGGDPQPHRRAVHARLSGRAAGPGCRSVSNSGTCVVRAVRRCPQALARYGRDPCCRSAAVHRRGRTDPHRVRCRPAASCLADVAPRFDPLHELAFTTWSVTPYQRPNCGEPRRLARPADSVRRPQCRMPPPGGATSVRLRRRCAQVSFRCHWFLRLSRWPPPGPPQGAGSRARVGSSSPAARSPAAATAPTR